MSEVSEPTIVWFDAQGAHDLDVVGGKCRNLARLTAHGLPVPPGFTVTTAAYRDHLTRTGVGREIDTALAAGDDEAVASRRIMAAFAAGQMRPAIATEIAAAYGALGRKCGRDALAVAVRSSATTEDLAEASFAGQQSTYLDVTGVADVIGRVQDCWASLFTPHAIAYRRQRGAAHGHAPAMAAGVQTLVPARVAGVMFTIDPVDGDRGRIVIEACWGLGETLVGGEVDPDRFVLDRASARVVDRRIARKTVALVHGPGGPVRQAVPPPRQTLPCLTDDDLARLLDLALRVEAALGPDQDIEWAIEDDVYLLQARPVTTHPGTIARAPERPATLPPLYRDILRNLTFGGAAAAAKTRNDN